MKNMARKYPQFPPIIKVDFDGTMTEVNDFRGFNENPSNYKPRQYAKEVLNELRSKGAILILYTNREGEYLEIAKQWLDEHGIVFDYYNENHTGLPFDSRKVFADYGIDDMNYTQSDQTIDFLKLREIVLSDPYFTTI